MYRLTDSISYIDYVLVAEDHRGRGICTQLINRSMEYAKGTNIILDSVPEFESMYGRYGFKLDQPMFEVDITIPGRSESHAFQKHPSVEIVTANNIENVMTFDETLHPLGHRAYFQHMLLDPESIGLCYVQGGKVTGLILYSAREALLNSLYADDLSIVKALLSSIMYLLSVGHPPDLPTVPSSSIEESLSDISHSQTKIQYSKHNAHNSQTKIRDGQIRIEESLTNDSLTTVHAVLLEHNKHIFKDCLDDLAIKSVGPNFAGMRMVSHNSIEGIAYNKIYSTVYFNAYIL